MSKTNTNIILKFCINKIRLETDMIKEAISKLVKREDLSTDVMEQVMEEIMTKQESLSKPN